ncbi:hypothetical protein HYC85_027679 [Camellia sinensis]|uniref:Uncharacterized protein n=1 Tax=Camellia sinensis TaxID=4442 RepID=A0A7J7FV11_CAMSI|nr:hypothetical protein HYC85_027679 [Camellia sinensis]
MDLISRMLIGSLSFWEVLLEKALDQLLFLTGNSSTSRDYHYRNEFGRGKVLGVVDLRGRKYVQGEIPAVQEGVGQANVAEPVGQQAMGALAREIAGALGILRAGNQVAEAGPSFLEEGVLPV